MVKPTPAKASTKATASPPAWHAKQCQRPAMRPEIWAAKLGLCRAGSPGAGWDGSGQWQRHSSRTPGPGSGTLKPARRKTAGREFSARTLPTSLRLME